MRWTRRADLHSTPCALDSFSPGWLRHHRAWRSLLRPAGRRAHYSGGCHAGAGTWRDARLSLTACERGAQARASLPQPLTAPGQVAPTLRAPLILFTYFNPILRRGLEPFIAELSACGVGGLLIPDIPLEETAVARQLCARYGLQLVLLATPTTSLERMAKIADATNGFVYLVSVTGVTGVQEKMQERVQGLVRGQRSAQVTRAHAQPVDLEAEKRHQQAHRGGLRHLEAGAGCANRSLGRGWCHCGQRARSRAWRGWLAWCVCAATSCLCCATELTRLAEEGLSRMTALITSIRKALPERASTPLDFLRSMFTK